MEYLSISQTAERWGITRRRIQMLCFEGRIPGTIKIGSFGVIPVGTGNPRDLRIKSGKYLESGFGMEKIWKTYL